MDTVGVADLLFRPQGPGRLLIRCRGRRPEGGIVSSRVVTALVALVAFWIMFGVFALFGGQFDLLVAGVLALGALAVAAVDRARRGHRRAGTTARRTT